MSGFALLAVFTLLFTAFVASDMELFMAEDDYTATSQDARVSEYDRISDYRHANITITKLTYSSGSGTVYVENTGNVILDPDYVDFILDGEWFAEGSVQLSMSNEWWEPGEELTIDFTRSLGGGYHEVKVTTGEGVYAVLRFYLPVGGAMMAYYDATWAEHVPRYRTWNGSAWSNENGADAIDGSVGIEIEWFVLKAAPTRDEYILGTLDLDDDVNVQVWQNGSWVSSLEVSNNIWTGQSHKRAFDIAYERVSGRAIIVYQDNTPQPKYRIWDGTAWSSENTISNMGTGIPWWIVLASHPSTDEIILAILNDARDIYAQVWNGASWGNDISLTNNTETRDYQCFDIAYESSSGRALVAWAEDRSSTPQYVIWNSGSGWSGVSSANSVGSDRIRWIKLASDPSSDRILMGTLDDDEDVNVQVWDGSSWGDVREVDNSVERSNRRVFDVAYENSSGVAMVVIGDGNDRSPDYYTCSTGVCNAGDWAPGEAVDVGDDIDWIALEPDPFSNDVMMMVKDQGWDVSVQRWNTTTWVIDPGAAMGAGGEVEDNSDTDYESFAIAYALFIDREM